MCQHKSTRVEVLNFVNKNELKLKAHLGLPDFYVRQKPCSHWADKTHIQKVILGNIDISAINKV